MKRVIFGSAVYGSTVKEMDVLYPRCRKEECGGRYYHTCVYYCHMAVADPEDPEVAWCTQCAVCNAGTTKNGRRNDGKK